MSKKKTSNNNNSSYYETYQKQAYESGHILGIDFSQNPEQRELIRLINQNSIAITYCFGNAGTGKTFTALAASFDLVKIRKKYSKIFYIREPIEVGRSLGFLPGGLDDKYGVYLGGFFDNLEHISSFSGININDLKSCVEMVPPQFIRGRSIDDAICIVDEAQNLSLDTIQTIATRLGKYCKLVFIGSLNQIDVKGMSKTNNSFEKSYEILKDFPFVGRVDLIKSERSEYCAQIDEAFTNYKENLIIKEKG